MSVQTTRIGQHPNQSLTDFIRLFTNDRARPIEGGPVSHHTEHSHGRGPIFPDLFLELSASFVKLLAAQFVGTNSGAVDQASSMHPGRPRQTLKQCQTRIAHSGVVQAQ